MLKAAEEEENRSSVKLGLAEEIEFDSGFHSRVVSTRSGVDFWNGSRRARFISCVFGCSVLQFFEGIFNLCFFHLILPSVAPTFLAVCAACVSSIHALQ